MGHHVPLQHGRGAEDLPTRGAGVVLLGVHLVDVLAVILQCGEAHPAFLAVIGIFYVWFHEGRPREEGVEGKKQHRQQSMRCGLLCATPHTRLCLEVVQGHRLQKPEVSAAIT